MPAPDPPVAAPPTVRVLFVTRKFPPVVGGMELLAARTADALAGRTRLHLVALRRSQRHLWWFLPLALFRSAARVLSGRVDYVLCGDAVTALALFPVALLRRAPVASAVHGLDLTLPLRPYRAAVGFVLRRVDRVIANSDETRRQAEALGVAPERVSVVNPGVRAPAVTRASRREARDRLVARLGLGPDDVLLVTVGRLVRRKGVRWFIESVFGDLPDGARYLVAGTGSDVTAIREAIERHGLQDRVRLLGLVDDAVRDELMAGADVFVMPNVPVPGDMEGFGLVAVEAALHGTPVVASALEGIRDAVVEGETGFLCPAGDAAAFADTLRQLLSERASLPELGWRFRKAAETRYSVDRMGAELLCALAATRRGGS